jgi:hypothetical protein
MRFAGALSVLAFGAGSLAFGQAADDQAQQIKDLQRDLARIQAQLDAMQKDGAPAQGLSGVDGAVRQSPADPAAEPRRLNISAPGIEGIDLFGGVGIRADYWGNFNAGNGQNDLLSVGQEAWLGAHAKVSEKTSAGLTLHYSGIWGNNTFGGLDSQASNRLTNGAATTTNATNNPNVSVTEAYLLFKDVYNQNVDVTAGRQKIELGEERILGDDEWRLNRTAFDGFRLDQTLGSDLGHWTFVALRLADLENGSSTELTPTDGNVIQNADLFGIYYTLKRDEIGTADFYVFQLEDMNYGNTAGRTRWTTYGARWMSPDFGGFTFDAEGATQFGKFLGSRTGNYGFGTYAMHMCAAWSPSEKVEYFKGVHAAYDYASGGSSTSDNFQQLYPSLHGWFGMTDFFSWTNIRHFTLGTDLDYMGGTVGLSYHWSDMAKSSPGFIGYNAASAGASGNSKHLGQELDVNYTVDCTKTTKVGMGIGYFFPGEGFHQMTGAANDMVFAYLGFRVIF